MRDSADLEPAKNTAHLHAQGSNNDGTDDLPALGLPDHWVRQHIPRQSDLRRASEKALHSQRAFLLYHRDHPDEIAQHLERLIEVVLAASQVKGDHQLMAIDSGVDLSFNYWIRGGKLKDWTALFMPLLSIALELGDTTRLSKLYRAWSLFLAVQELNPEQTRKILETALDYAIDSGREDLRLFARIEQFNFNAPNMGVGEALALAEDLLASARQLNFIFEQGRVYLSLARAMDRHMRRKEMTMFAQQALVFFEKTQFPEMSGYALVWMLNGIEQRANSATYRMWLDRLDAVAAKTNHPNIKGDANFLEARVAFHQGDLEVARRHAIEAWLAYRPTRYITNLSRTQHMLGLIEMNRRQWARSALNLRMAIKGYIKSNDYIQQLHAQHALAWLWVKQEAWSRALPALQAALVAAEARQNDPRCRSLIQTLKSDIESVSERLNA